MYVAPEKADGTIGLGRDASDVSVPAQVITRAILMYKIAINITYSSRCKN
jgi:hypothetical protein